MYKKLTCTMALAGLMTLPAIADTTTMELTGTIRDFTTDHPDFQNPNKNFGVKTGMVEDTLDADGKPVLKSSNGTRGMVTSVESHRQWFRDVPGVNIALPLTITLENSDPSRPEVFIFAREKQQPAPYNYFFPIDGKGFADWADGSGRHNFYFTYELETEFTYTDPAERDYPMTFKFTGDDDVWVFINNKLACDIGGVHGQASDEVNLDDEVEALGLEVGETYSLVLFFAERHTTQSNFRVETSLTLVEVPPTTISPLYD
jgi:fibro-slime domain-containing protein